MFKKLSTKISLILIAVMTILMAALTFYFVQDRTKEMNRLILEKGVSAASAGARVMGEMLDSVIDNGVFSLQDVFDRKLIPVELPPAMISKYRDSGVGLQDFASIQKYHYASGLDSYLENRILPLQDEFLRDNQFAYAALVDAQGYLPVHNSVYNRPLTGDFKADLLNNRSKRIFNDEVGIRAIAGTKEPYILQTYRRDTGELMWDIAVAVTVKGRHWGAFRVGLSMEKAEETIANLRNKLIIIMGALLLIMVIIIDRATAFMLRPLQNLHEGVARVARGDLSGHQKEASADEVGGLARAFNKMTEDLNVYVKNLKETTVAKERIESELSIARQIQSSMLPRIFPPFPHKKDFDLLAFMEPAKEVGGDFFDFFLVGEDKLVIIISDVSGKGVPAALYMVITKTLLKTEGLRETAPDKILSNVNNILYPDNEASMFATVFCAVLDINSGALDFANAGHNRPLLCAGSKTFEFIETSSGVPVGAAENFAFRAQRIQLSPGDIIFFYTDGVTEAMNEKGKLFSEASLQKTLNDLREESAEKILSKTKEEIDAFVGDTPQFDDMTMIVLKYIGPQKN